MSQFPSISSKAKASRDGLSAISSKDHCSGGSEVAISSSPKCSAGSLWVPSQLSSISNWYKAKLELYANNDPVDSFKDQIGSGNLLGSTTERPTFKTNSGDPYLEFNGTSNVLSANPAWPAFIDFAVCMVFEVVADVSIYQNYLASYTWTVGSPGNPDIIRWQSGGGAAPEGPVPTRPTGLSVLFIERSGATARIRFRGSEVSVGGDAGTATHQAVFLGGDPGGNFSNIRVRELIACNDNLSGSDFTKLGAYLLSEYGGHALL